MLAASGSRSATARVYTRQASLGAAPLHQAQQHHLCRAQPMPTRFVVSKAQQQGGGLGDWVRQLADFGAWAPKASRAWRLGQTPNDPNAEPDAVDELQARLQQQAQQQPRASNSAGSSAPPASSSATLEGGGNSSAAMSGAPGDLDLPPTGSFSDTDDSVLNQMLSKRIQSLSGSLDEEPQPAMVAAAATGVAAEEQEGLSGEEMRRLILAKYGKTYDVSLVRRDGFGKSFVAFNITWHHLEQRSFRLTEEQFMEKISSVAYLLNILGQSDKVRAFLKQPAKSERGLPRRPVVGTAISVQLDLPQHTIDEFFGSGYF